MSKDETGHLAGLNLDQFYDDTDDDEWVELSQAEEESTERFQNSQLIASGGMKDIFKVFDSKTSRYIAMAKLRKDISAEHTEGFLQEAFLTAKLEHPNIISVYEIGKDEDFNPFFTMELKVGDSLLTILKKRESQDEKYLTQFPLGKLLEIFLKICDAVAYAHSEGVLHLDIKPDNIQVGQFGEVQLCDWGLGSYIYEQKHIDGNGKIKGTPGYMSPEQSLPDQEKNHQSDIYSLGALLYSLLTDKAPGKGGIQTVIRDTLNGEIKFPVERFPKKEIPASLDAVVRKAMSVELTHRYKDVDALKAEVQKYLTGHSTVAENAGVLTEASLFYKRNKTVCHVVLLAFILILTGTTAFPLKLQESKHETEKTLAKLTTTYVDLEKARENEKKSFELYKVQNAKQIQLSKELLKQSYTIAHKKTKNPLFYNNPMANSKEATVDLLKYYDVTGHHGVARLIIEMKFISHKFDQVQHMNVADREMLSVLANRYAEKPLNEDGAINDKDFARLLYEMNENLSQTLNQRLMERLIVYNMKLNKRAYVRTEVLVELLRCWNPRWQPTNFSYKKSSLKLKVFGPSLKILAGTNNESSKQSFLRLIKVNFISVANSGVDSIRQFIGASTNTLDVRSSAITSIKGVNVVRNLNHLIISKGQLLEVENIHLPDSVKVEFKD